MSLQKLGKMARHGLEVVGDEDAVMLGCQDQNNRMMSG